MITAVHPCSRSVGGQGSVFGWWINQIVDVLSELGKTPSMWSPLAWDPESPPQKLVDAKAILNLWTGDLQALAYNITKKGTNDVVLSSGWYLPAGGAYGIDPQDKLCPNSTCSAAQKARIIGGEACQWGEVQTFPELLLIPGVIPAFHPEAIRAWTPPTSFLRFGPT